MSRLEEYKERLSGGEQAFLEEHEQAFSDFWRELDSDGALIGNFDESKVNRLQNLVRSGNAPVMLMNNLWKFISTREEVERNISILEDLGYRADNVAEQFGSILCHVYQVHAEKLKLHLVSLIDLSVYGLNGADSAAIKLLVREGRKVLRDQLSRETIEYLVSRKRTEYVPRD